LCVHVKDTHGIDAFGEAKRWVGSGVKRVRQALSKRISPRPGGGGGGGGGRGGNSSKTNSSRGGSNKNFDGKGKKLGKR